MTLTPAPAARWHDLVTDQLALRPDARALSDSSGACWSWADLQAATTDLADRLRDAGVRPGDRVLLLSENCAAAAAALFATSTLNAAVIPFNARQTGAELDRVIAHAQPAAVLMTSHVSSDAQAHAARLGATPLNGAFGTLDLLQRSSAPDDELKDVAVILYTTGTTGDPKGVMLSHENIRFGGQTSAQLRGMTSDDLIYGVLPVTHVFGLASVLTAAACAGAHVRLEARFSAAKLYSALRDGVTLLSAVPQMHALLMQFTKEQGLERLGSPALRYVSSGGAPLDPAWKRKAEAFYGVALQNGYGMTETTAGICSTRNVLGDDDISTGRPLPGVEVRIVGDTGEGGEILTRGPHVMKGYFRNPTETVRALDADGWLHTGDVGRLDDQGRLYILGRSKELIIHGGFNVYPPEVEAVLSDHPKVIQAAVIGHPLDGDEIVLAFCQISESDPPDVEELRAFAARRLAGYKCPARIILSATLPTAPTGKILKHKLNVNSP